MSEITEILVDNQSSKEEDIQWTQENSEENETPVKDHETAIDNTLERIGVLRQTLSGLRKELQEEQDMWKKEVEEVAKIRGNISVSAFESVQSVNKTNDTLSLNSTSFATLSESKWTKSQDERFKLNMKKQEEVFRSLNKQVFRQKLMEVDNLCNIELERLQQNVAILKPLMEIVKEWHLPPSEPVEEVKERRIQKRSVSEDRVSASTAKYLHKIRSSRAFSNVESANNMRMFKEEYEKDPQAINSVSAYLGSETSSIDQYPSHLSRKPYTFVV